MQTSKLALLVAALAVPVLVAAGCVDGSTCLRNSDCPAVDICSVGACILAPVDDGEGGTDEGGLVEASTLPDTGAVTDTGAHVDATLADGGASDGAVTNDGGASSDGASDANASDSSDAADAAAE